MSVNGGGPSDAHHDVPPLPRIVGGISAGTDRQSSTSLAAPAVSTAIGVTRMDNDGVTGLDLDSDASVTHWSAIPLLAVANTAVRTHPKTTISWVVFLAAAVLTVALVLTVGASDGAAAQAAAVGGSAAFTGDKESLPSLDAVAAPASWTSAAAYSGFDRNTSTKWGGGLIADIDGDGWYDVVLHNHDKTPLALYWNTRRGGGGGARPATAFARAPDPFPWRFDAHGLTAGDLFLNGADAVVAAQGGNYGRNPGKPMLLRAPPSARRSLARGDEETGLAAATPGGRGRTPLLVDLDRDGDLDLILINYERDASGARDRQHIVENRGGRLLRWRGRTGLEFAGIERAILTDLNGDGRLDVVGFPYFRIYIAVGDFAFEDRTRAWTRAIPDAARVVGSVRAAAELDANGDGRWDVYVVRGPEPDVLLLNVDNDHLVLGAPPAGGRRDHSDVTVGDFNNDGHMDVFLTSAPPVADGATVRPRRDVLLTGDGGGRFTASTDHGATVDTVAVGDSVQAVDFDRDGTLDLLVGSGPEVPEQGPFGGWDLFRGVPPPPTAAARAHWLEVAVGRSPDRRAAPTGALVTVTVAGGGGDGGDGGGGTRAHRRRVGGAGGSGSTDNLRVVHFGLGAAAAVLAVDVRWSNGAAVRRTGVPVDGVYEVTAV